MYHSTLEQPTFGEHDESDALPSDAIAAAELDDLRDRRVYAARLGCVLHILHIAVTAGMASTFFMGPLGKGPWNEWERDHVFSLLGLVWYNTSRSDSCNANFERWKRKVAAKLPDKEWYVKFIKPAETRWMVVFDGAKILEQRWEEITWPFCDWAPQNILKTAFKSYWYFFGSSFFSGGGEEVVSMATPETMTKRRFLTHPCSTVAYAMRVLFFVLCALKPKEVYSSLRFSIFGATPPSGQGT